MATSPSSTAHGGQHDIKYVALELLLRAAFVVEKFGVLCLNQLVYTWTISVFQGQGSECRVASHMELLTFAVVRQMHLSEIFYVKA